MVRSLPLLAACFLLGILARRWWRFPASTPQVLNKVILYIALPAVVVKALHTLAFPPGLALAASMMWLVFGGSYALFMAFQRRLRRPSAAALVLTTGLANTAFLGIPMIEGLLGTAAVGPAVVVDQLGSFLVLSTVGLWVALRASTGSIAPWTLLKRVLFFPSFLALGFALLTRSVAFPPGLTMVLARLGDMLTPLALIAVGFQLELGDFRGRVRALAAGLGYRLVLAPLMVLGVFTLLGGRGMLREIVVLQAGMAPMITGGILAADHDLDPPLAALVVGVGIPLSFLSIPLWFALLQALH